MTFEVGADAYGRFMGRYSEQLAARFADAAGVCPGQRALDVGCGPGALTAELVRRLGPEAVCAAEPSPPFAAAAAERLPGVQVRCCPAERLPFPGAAFDLALAQLAVHFMDDPVAGLREMRRVTRPGGTVAACVWDHGGGRSPTTPLWEAVRGFDPSARDRSARPGTHEGELARLFAEAGMEPGGAATLTVQVRYATFEQWWEPFTLGIGPAGAYVASLTGERRGQLREHCRRSMPTGSFVVSATAWTVISTTSP